MSNSNFNSETNKSDSKTESKSIPDIPNIQQNSNTVGNKINKLFSGLGSMLEPVVNKVADVTSTSVAYAVDKIPENDISKNYKTLQNLEEILLKINQRLDQLDDRITAIEVNMSSFDDPVTDL
jgi:hypothetical protein